MEQPTITVQQLTKTYRVPEREAGLKASVRSLFRREYRNVDAVRCIDFQLAPAEMIGLIGPNGAGKTTTLKMLSGLLYPTSGEIQVAGFKPWQRQPEFLRQISMVLGNKSQMLWDIPPTDTFRVLGEIYGLSRAELKQRLDELAELFEMQDLLSRPVRNLSLGERMKCELAAGLLHRPAVLFLDEPTLGLDVTMQVRLRRFIAAYNRKFGATIILTSHSMADVTALCKRILLIHNGQIIYDGSIDGLTRQFAPYKIVQVDLDERANGDTPSIPVSPAVELIAHEEHSFTLRLERTAAPAVISDLLARFPVLDMKVEDPPIESVIDQVYQEARHEAV